MAEYSENVFENYLPFIFSNDSYNSFLPFPLQGSHWHVAETIFFLKAIIELTCSIEFQKYITAAYMTIGNQEQPLFLNQF